MLDFRVLEPGEEIGFSEGAVECSPHRAPDFSIDIDAFHRILDHGLAQIASDVGLSFFQDALLEWESCKSVLAVLVRIDESLKSASAQTETREMTDLFSRAVRQNLGIVVVCD